MAEEEKDKSELKKMYAELADLEFQFEEISSGFYGLMARISNLKARILAANREIKFGEKSCPSKK